MGGSSGSEEGLSSITEGRDICMTSWSIGGDSSGRGVASIFFFSASTAGDVFFSLVSFKTPASCEFLMFNFKFLANRQVPI
jgi:hypothetical protein